VLVTSWQHYRDLPRRLEELSAPPAVIDGRRMLDKENIATYSGIGLG
jgi:hypothetical protein